MVEIRTRDVFASMRPDLTRVEERLEEAARIDYPMAAELILGLVRAGGKRLRPLVLLLAARSFEYDRDALVDGLRTRGHRDARPLAGPEDLPMAIARTVKPGDYVVCLGAGNITQWAYSLPGDLAALPLRAAAE